MRIYLAKLLLLIIRSAGFVLGISVRLLILTIVLPLIVLFRRPFDCAEGRKSSFWKKGSVYIQNISAAKGFYL